VPCTSHPPEGKRMLDSFLAGRWKLGDREETENKRENKDFFFFSPFMLSFLHLLTCADIEH
jgi:hypothetical protein